MFDDLTSDEYYNDTLIWGDDDFIDFDDEPEDEDMDRDYWEGMAEDALMEYHLGLDY